VTDFDIYVFQISFYLGNQPTHRPPPHAAQRTPACALFLSKPGRSLPRPTVRPAETLPSAIVDLHQPDINLWTQKAVPTRSTSSARATGPWGSPGCLLRDPSRIRKMKRQGRETAQSRTPKGVERFGAGMEKGGGDRSARELSEQERSGRKQRRRGMRSGSKNALRQRRHERGPRLATF
jgi:hypothetical protein